MMVRAEWHQFSINTCTHLPLHSSIAQVQGTQLRHGWQPRLQASFSETGLPASFHLLNTQTHEENQKVHTAICRSNDRSLLLIHVQHH